MFHCLLVFYLIISYFRITEGHPKNLAWSGGPIHMECEHSVEHWTNSGKYIKDNVIAIKAVAFKDEVYVITPRLKRGVLATVWLIVRGRRGVELQAYPGMHAHTIADCEAVQNAVDIHLDHLGNLWVLDSGVIETIELPTCTCAPKVVVISILLGKVTKRIKLGSQTDPVSQLQNVLVEYGIGGKPYIYISDASRGAILVHDTMSEDGWSVMVCAPATGIQMALVKRGPIHNVLMLVRIQEQGLIELDTSLLRRKKSAAPLRVIGENEKPMLLLGFDVHHLYLRHAECADVLSWDIRNSFDSSNIVNIHSAGPHMIPTSVTSDPMKRVLVVLDSNYADTIRRKQSTYHKLTFIGQI